MKTILISAIMIFTSFSTFARSSCPRSWPIMIVENKISQNISIVVQDHLIRNETMVGNIELAISSAYSPWVEIKGNQVNVNFAYKKDDIVTEKWSSLASITQTEVAGNDFCHKVEIEKGVAFTEIRELARPDCMGLPRWMCGKKTYHFLKITKSLDGKEFYTKSLVSVSQ